MLKRPKDSCSSSCFGSTCAAAVPDSLCEPKPVRQNNSSTATKASTAARPEPVAQEAAIITCSSDPDRTHGTVAPEDEDDGLAIRKLNSMDRTDDMDLASTTGTINKNINGEKINRPPDLAPETSPDSTTSNRLQRDATAEGCSSCFSFLSTAAASTTRHGCTEKDRSTLTDILRRVGQSTAKSKQNAGFRKKSGNNKETKPQRQRTSIKKSKSLLRPDRVGDSEDVKFVFEEDEEMTPRHDDRRRGGIFKRHNAGRVSRWADAEDVDEDNIGTSTRNHEQSAADGDESSSSSSEDAEKKVDIKQTQNWSEEDARFKLLPFSSGDFRHYMCDFMEAAWENIFGDFGDDETLGPELLGGTRKSHLDKLRSPDTWAGNLEIWALTKLWPQIRVEVVDHCTGGSLFFPDDESGRDVNLPILHVGNHYDAVVDPEKLLESLLPLETRTAATLIEILQALNEDEYFCNLREAVRQHGSAPSSKSASDWILNQHVSGRIAPLPRRKQEVEANKPVSDHSDGTADSQSAGANSGGDETSSSGAVGDVQPVKRFYRHRRNGSVDWSPPPPPGRPDERKEPLPPPVDPPTLGSRTKHKYRKVHLATLPTIPSGETWQEMLPPDTVPSTPNTSTDSNVTMEHVVADAIQAGAEARARAAEIAGLNENYQGRKAAAGTSPAGAAPSSSQDNRELEAEKLALTLGIDPNDQEFKKRWIEDVDAGLLGILADDEAEQDLASVCDVVGIPLGSADRLLSPTSSLHNNAPSGSSLSPTSPVVLLDDVLEVPFDKRDEMDAETVESDGDEINAEPRRIMSPRLIDPFLSNPEFDKEQARTNLAAAARSAVQLSTSSGSSSTTAGTTTGTTSSADNSPSRAAAGQQLLLEALECGPGPCAHPPTQTGTKTLREIVGPLPLPPTTTITVTTTPAKMQSYFEECCNCSTNLVTGATAPADRESSSPSSSSPATTRPKETRIGSDVFFETKPGIPDTPRISEEVNNWWGHLTSRILADAYAVRDILERRNRLRARERRASASMWRGSSGYDFSPELNFVFGGHRTI
ncbi:unnamed protein product [Amoebophrya sp. A120]|nr:unnamed protein product [Amoebophrya sp. A120]|eukprot:GSA120T00013066001.1